MNILSLISRDEVLFDSDVYTKNTIMSDIVSNSRFLVIGGAGTIGQAVSKEIYKRDPKALHVVDISENNMVELVRKIRSTIGYFDTEFKTFAIDSGAIEFKALINSEKGYDYVFNLSALKHVRSEKDPFTLMRLITVNIFNTIDNIKLFIGIYTWQM